MRLSDPLGGELVLSLVYPVVSSLALQSVSLVVNTPQWREMSGLHRVQEMLSPHHLQLQQASPLQEVLDILLINH